MTAPPFKGTKLLRLGSRPRATCLGLLGPAEPHEIEEAPAGDAGLLLNPHVQVWGGRRGVVGGIQLPRLTNVNSFRQL